jgi:hypothetical protein
MEREMRDIVLLEANEIPYRVFDAFIAQEPDSQLAALFGASTQLTTVCEDGVELDPWISWPTLHRGVNDDRHGILHLGQSLERADAEYPPVWRILADAGISVGVCGSLHSSNLPRDLSRYKFYLPDFFDDETFAKPGYLLPFQEFNLGMTRRSARNVDTGLPRNLLKQFVKSLPSLGLRTGTVATIANQFITERRQPHLRLRRRSLQSLIMMDVFARQLRKTAPQFATFYTNHVAASMHRYWAAAFPDDVGGTVMPGPWIEKYAPEIMMAMRILDKMVGTLKRRAEAEGSILLIATSMGQHPVNHRPTSRSVTIRDLDKFLGAMGVPSEHFRKRHAMFPSVGALVEAEYVQVLRDRLALFRVGDSQFIESDTEIHPLSFGVYEDGFVTFLVSFPYFDGERIAHIGNEQYSFQDIGLGDQVHEDGIGVSAHHDPEGALIIFDPQAPSIDTSRRQVSSVEIAPSILRHFGVVPPSYMASDAAVLGARCEVPLSKDESLTAEQIEAMKHLQESQLA